MEQQSVSYCTPSICKQLTVFAQRDFFFSGCISDECNEMCGKLRSPKYILI